MQQASAQLMRCTTSYNAQKLGRINNGNAQIATTTPARPVFRKTLCHAVQKQVHICRLYQLHTPLPSCQRPAHLTECIQRLFSNSCFCKYAAIYTCAVCARVHAPRS